MCAAITLLTPAAGQQQALSNRLQQLEYNNRRRESAVHTRGQTLPTWVDAGGGDGGDAGCLRLAVQPLCALRVGGVVADVQVGHAAGDGRLQHVAVLPPLEGAGAVDDQVCAGQGGGNAGRVVDVAAAEGGGAQLGARGLGGREAVLGAAREGEGAGGEGAGQGRGGGGAHAPRPAQHHHILDAHNLRRPGGRAAAGR